MWDIQSQTKIKLLILKNYLAAWATVLKSTQDVLYYVDGFAGPGWYNDPDSGEKVDGSPVQAVKLYLDHKINRGWQYELKFINVESDRKTFQELAKETSRFEKDAAIKNIPGEFLDKLGDVLHEIEGHHSFFFVDPFGISGIDFSELERVFKRQETEILLNFNYDGLQRCVGELKNLEHPDERRRTRARKTVERVCEMLNVSVEELEEITTYSLIPKDKKISLLRKYRTNLLKYKSFVYPLSINYPGQERTFYYLIFMTENIVALKIMKDVMKKAKRMEKTEQLFLPLPEIDMDRLKARLYEKYRGRLVQTKEIYVDWLPKVFILDGEDYLARHIDNALNSLAKAKDMPVTKIPGKKSWNPYYRFD